MPAPGGAHKGSASSSKGYAGSGPASSGGKTGGAGSGNKSAGGKMGSGSSQTGGLGGGKSPGGVNAGGGKPSGGIGGLGGGKMGASSSQTGGMKSSGGMNAGGGGLRGPAGAASRPGGIGGLGGVSRPSPTGGGLRGPLGPTGLAAHTNPTGFAGSPSRPMSTVGSVTGLSTSAVPTPRTHPFRDPSRFSYGLGMRPNNVSKGLANLGMMSQLANAQTAFGKPLQINAAYAATGHAKKGAHPKGLAFDVQVPNTMDRGPFIEAATRAGFTRTGTYGPGLRGVHVDTRPGTGTWGATKKSASTPGWHKDAVAAGKKAGSLDMEAIAASTRTPTFGRPSTPQTQIASASPSQFPGRPMEMAGAFPAEDRRPTEFPGRPSMPQTFNSQIAARPEPTQNFSGMIAARPQPAQNFNSMVAGRPEMPGNVTSQVASRPMPEAPPSNYTTDNFPGRPSPPDTFNSQIAARPSLPQDFASQIAARPAPPQSFNTHVAGRPEFPGSLPAAQPQPTYANPARSYAGLPTSGFPQAAAGPAIAEAQPPAGGGFFDTIGNTLSGVTDSVTGVIDAAKPLAKTAWDNINHPLVQFAAGLSRPARPNRGLRDQKGRFVKLSKAQKLAQKLQDMNYSVTEATI